MKLYPVVHINEVPSAARQAEIALDAGSDGVYLISHGSGYATSELFEVHNAVTSSRPDAFVGLNLLGYEPLEATQEIEEALAQDVLHQAPAALWVDDIYETRLDQRGYAPSEAKAYKDARPSIRTMKLLGGVAFKYTASYTEDPLAVSTEVAQLEQYVDVITTSGPGTGEAPPVAKIAAMKRVANKPLAVASGISLDNIDDYRGMVDELLVASSIETAPYSGVFDRYRLFDTIHAAHSI